MRKGELSTVASGQCLSVCEAGKSGSEELKKCPPPFPAVLWLVNAREKRTQIEKKTLWH